MERQAERIGRLVEVKGNRVTFDLSVDPAVAIAEEYYPGQPGSHIRIPFGGEDVIGVVESIRLAENPAESSKPKQQAMALLLGTVPVVQSSGEPKAPFVRGVSILPTAGKDVMMLPATELKWIYGEGDENSFSFGTLSVAPDRSANVHMNRFFGRHVAILGTTGSGKSCAVASILQAVTKTCDHPHILILDLHGEYASAFPEKSNLVSSEDIELPYWLLSFEELADFCVDVTEFTAHNQIMGLHRAIRSEKETAASAEDLSLGVALSVDSPLWYDMRNVVRTIEDWNTEMVQGARGEKQGPLYGVFTRFLMRLQTRMDDPRYAFLFQPKRYTKSRTLPELLRTLLTVRTGAKLTVLDLSGVPSDVLGVVVSVVSRLVFEFNFWNPARADTPVCVVYEEAHNYASGSDAKGNRAAKEAVERLAKEGRKYGIGIVVVSQRPNELSPTVVSQCNTFIALRLSNPRDQEFVQRLVPESLAGLMDMLPALRTGEALVLGDSVIMPTRVQISMPSPEPASRDIDFRRGWRNEPVNVDPQAIARRWWLRRRDV